MLEVVPVPKRREPWLGIGVDLNTQDYREALSLSQLDFNVISKPAKVELNDSTPNMCLCSYYEDVPGAKVNLVEGSNKILGCVSSQYGVIQNENAFSLMQPLCDAGAVITHAGMTEQGLCFMVASWGMEDFNGEAYNIDIMATNSFNGLYPCGLIMSPRRIICQNMYRKLARNDNILHVRHMSLAPRRIEEAKVNEQKIVWYLQNFGEIITALSKHTLFKADREKFIATLFPYPSNEEAIRYETSKAQVDRLREEFEDMYVNASDVKHLGNQALRWAHAYYDYLSHNGSSRRVTSGDPAHKRLTRLISGEAVNNKAINILIK